MFTFMPWLVPPIGVPGRDGIVSPWVDMILLVMAFSKGEKSF